MNLLTSLSQCEIVWLCLIVVLVLVEIGTAGLFTIWFAAGAVVAVIFAALDFPVLFQIFIFLLVSGVLLFFTRPLAAKLTGNRKTATNADRYIGKMAIITEPVNNLNQTGRATVLGQDWSVRTENDTDSLPAGTKVEVLAIQGAKLIVKKVQEE